MDERKIRAWLDDMRSPQAMARAKAKQEEYLRKVAAEKQKDLDSIAAIVSDLKRLAKHRAARKKRN